MTEEDKGEWETRYWTDVQVKKLMDMVGGHPYLVRLALDRV